MSKRLLAAFALIVMMSAAAEAQNTTIEGWVIVPGAKHSDNIEVRITTRDGFDSFASTIVSDSGRYMFTNLDLSIGRFDIYVLIDGYRESRTPIALPPGMSARMVFPISWNIILIPDPTSRRQAEKKDAYTAILLDEYAKGLEQIGLKNPELAVAHLEKVTNEVPDFYDAHINLGLAYQDLFRWREAEKEFRIAHDLNAESARPLLALGRLFVDEAESEYQSGTKLDVVQPRLVKARDVLTEAITLDAGLAKAHYYMGAADYRSGFFANAERELKRALELDHALYEARYALIHVFADQKSWQAALDNADAFLLDYPDSSYRAKVSATRMGIVARMGQK